MSGIAKTLGVAVVVALIAIGGALLLPRGSGAATLVHADIDGQCAQLTPCFTTIQEAVDNAGGGNLSEVLVFPGLYPESVDLSRMGSAIAAEPDEIVIRAVSEDGVNPGSAAVNPDAAGGPGSGPAIFTSSDFPSDIHIDGLNVASPDTDAVRLVTGAGDVSLANMQASPIGDSTNDASGMTPGDDGFEITTTTGDVGIEHASANDGASPLGDGFEIHTTSGSISLDGVSALDNSGPAQPPSPSPANHGVAAFTSEGGNITVTQSNALRNSDDGFLLRTGVEEPTKFVSGDIVISASEASNNGGAGFDLDTGDEDANGGVVSVTDSFADANEDDGLLIDDVDGDVTLDGVVVTSNEGDGAFVDEVAGNIMVVDSLSEDNGGDGFDLESRTEPGLDIEVLRSTARNNGAEVKKDQYGFWIEATDRVVMDQVTTSGNRRGGINVLSAGDAELSAVLLTSLWVMDEITGVGIDELAPTVDASVSSSIICSNEAGLVMMAGETITATGNWWDSASGPTHPGNAGGSGDLILDGDSGGDGEVQFVPWIDTVTATELVPPGKIGGQAETGRSSTIAIQFADGKGSAFLGEGPGSPNVDGPFTITTNNGTLNGNGSSVNARVMGDEGMVLVELTPQTAGTATLAVSGPCGLGGQFEFDVEQGGINGDTDCDADVDTLDGLALLRESAGLPVTAECLVASGDTDCDGDRDSVDALGILRHVAALPPLPHPQPCRDIGS